VSGEQVEVGPGDDLFIPRGVIHGFTNETQQITKVLCVLTPGVLGPEFFREVSALMNGSVPPDPGKDERDDGAPWLDTRAARLKAPCRPQVNVLCF